MVLGLTIMYSMCGVVAFTTGLIRSFTNDPVLIGYGVGFLRIAGFSWGLGDFSQMLLCIMKTHGKTAKSTAIGSSLMILNLAHDP